MGTNSDTHFSLFSRTRQAALSLLLLRPDERFHLRQIVRLTGAGSGAVQRELSALVDGGLIRRETSGRQVYLQANTASPIFPELQGLILKTAGAVDLLRSELRNLESPIRAAAIFGSMAAATMHQGSDLDLLVISDDLSMRDLAGPIRQASARLGRRSTSISIAPKNGASAPARGTRSSSPFSPTPG